MNRRKFLIASTTVASVTAISTCSGIPRSAPRHQDLLHDGQDTIVKVRVRDDDAPIRLQRETAGEVERPTIDVAHTPPRFFHKNHSAGVVPDPLAIVFPRRQTKVNVGVAASHDGIFRLTVETRGGEMDAEPRGDLRRVAV